MRRESIFDMEIDILPPRFTGAHFLRNIFATEGSMDMRGIGKLTTVDEIQSVEFTCQWEPFVCSSGLIIVYYAFPNQQSFLVQAIEDFYEKIRVV
jgi:hypothetical protein